MLQAADAVDTAAAAADTAAAEPHGRADAAAPFPRPRGRGPPGCTWDVLKGGWFRADGSAWQKVRNEKRELARAAQRAERRAKKEEEEEREKYFSAKVTKQRLEPLMQRIALERKERLQEERLERKRLKCEARQAAIAARDARARLVRFDGNTVYCAPSTSTSSTLSGGTTANAASRTPSAALASSCGLARRQARATPPAALLPPEC